LALVASASAEPSKLNDAQARDGKSLLNTFPFNNRGGNGRQAAHHHDHLTIMTIMMPPWAVWHCQQPLLSGINVKEVVMKLT